MASPLGKYGIALKKTNKLIGSIDIRIDAQKQTAEIGYILNAQYHGNGYMTEAGNLILDLAFSILDIPSVFACHDIRNPKSGRVMSRLGMRKDGILRQSIRHKNEQVDMVYYSILNSEYLKRKKTTQ